MKKLLLILLLCLITTFAFSLNNTYIAVKAGYGQETSGIGVAADLRINYFGLMGGIGYFPMFGGDWGFEAGVKLHLPFPDTLSSFWIGAGYGLLGRQQTTSYSGTSTSTLYGPWALFGGAWVSKGGFLLDGSVGFGYSDSWGLLLTFQASIGFAAEM